jgi:hypothetical protein
LHSERRHGGSDEGVDGSCVDDTVVERLVHVVEFDHLHGATLRLVVGHQRRQRRREHAVGDDEVVG